MRRGNWSLESLESLEESEESGACGLFGGLGMPRDRTECDKAQRQVLCGREAAGLLLNLSVAL